MARNAHMDSTVLPGARVQVAYQAPNLYPKKWGLNQQTWVIHHDLSTYIYIIYIYTLWLFNVAMVLMAHLPIKNGDSP